MNIDVTQYRGSIGQHYTASRTPMTRKRRSYLDVLCINLFAIHGLRVLPIAIFLFIVPLLNESNSLYVNKGTQNILKQNRTLMCLDNFAYFCIVLCILLIISGVEQNPGPSLSVSSRSFSSVSDLSSDCSVFKNNVSFLHLNVQSIVPKLDIITVEYSSYDILSFTESWLKPNINDETLKLPGYKFSPFRRDRQHKTGGGGIVYVKEHINCIVRPDLQIDNIEFLWIEIKFKNKNYVYGTFYIPPDSGSQSWLDIEQSIDLALNNNHAIIIVGDFNNNQLNNNTNNKIRSLLTQYSLYQLIDEPTYITEHSSSTLDLLIVNDHRNIVFSEVGAPLLNQTRYHLPIIGFLNHYIEHSTIIRRKIFLYDRGDYNSYRQKLSTIDWDSMFTGHDIDSITCSIRQTINDIANDTIPNRIISIRKDNPPWLTTAIKKQI